MKNLKLSRLSYIILFVLAFTSCNKDDDQKMEPNPTPVPEKEVLTANVGEDHEIAIFEEITLDGSPSRSNLGNPINFKWQIIKRPEGSLAVILNDETPKPKFTPLKHGEYEIELTVSNASGSAKDRLFVKSIAAQAQILDKDITEDVRLPDRIPDSDLPDYIVTKDIVVNARLQLSPGVVIAFQRDVRLDINEGGVIESLGDPDNKVTFTGVEKSKGYWKGIVIFSNSNKNIFENTNILYAGSSHTLSTYKAALTLFGISKAQVSLKNTTIFDSGGYGLHVAAGSVINNFSENTFINNGEAGVYLDAANVRNLDKESVFSAGNGRNVVEIMQSELKNSFGAPETWEGFENETPYRIRGELTLSTGLELKPGVVVEVANNTTIVVNADGYIYAKGSPDKPIIFTGQSKVPGFWKGIRSYSKSPLNEMEYVEVNYAGSSPIVSGRKAGIAVTGAHSTLIIRNSRISNSGGYGIFVGYNSQINNDASYENIFEENAGEDILFEN